MSPLLSSLNFLGDSQVVATMLLRAPVTSASKCSMSVFTDSSAHAICGRGLNVRNETRRSFSDSEAVNQMRIWEMIASD